MNLHWENQYYLAHYYPDTVFLVKMAIAIFSPNLVDFYMSEKRTKQVQTQIYQMNSQIYVIQQQYFRYNIYIDGIIFPMRYNLLF